MKNLRSTLLAPLVTAALLCVSGYAVAELDPSEVTKVVMLGTGTPIADPARSGPSVAIVVNEEPYLVDFGPGVVRRAASASPQFGGSVSGMEVTRLRTAFLTHLHADHSSGYADLILTPWTMGRREPLEVFGPEGIVSMTEHVLKAYEEDIRYRLYGLEPANNKGWRVNVHTIEEGVIFKDENVEVVAFPVVHGSWPNAFGFRFTTPDRVIVVSGDIAGSEYIEEYAVGADILVHEAYSLPSLAARQNPFWLEYHGKNHTSAVDVGKLAARVRPRLLVLTHVLFFDASEEDVLAEVRSEYDGDIVVAKDLDVF